MDALDAPRNANGRPAWVTWARISPMIPPWLKIATHWPGWAATMRSRAPRTRALIDCRRLGTGDHVPALLADHLEGERVALGMCLR